VDLVDWRQYGVEIVAGVDEAGRGCLAGPVYAAAVVLFPDFVLPGLTDSKLLSPEVRTEFAEHIKQERLVGLWPQVQLKKLSN